MYILGAGLAGCIAAHLFPGARVLESAAEADLGAHKALLRFRTDEIGKITGIPFRRVRVTKAVAWGDRLFMDSVPLAAINDYSRKVVGRLQPRSIADIHPVDRWVAPDDFHARMARNLEGRILFEYRIDRVSSTGLWRGSHDEAGLDRTDLPVLSTVPLPLMLAMTDLKSCPPLNFERQAIYVLRGEVRDCDLHQTCYFADERTPIYRASITGSTLIVESIRGRPGERDLGQALVAFGLRPEEVLWEPEVDVQRYGKIVSLPATQRQALLLQLTQRYGVYSFGRFATWRNILLDDLPKDAERIRGLMRMGEYELQLRGAS